MMSNGDGGEFFGKVDFAEGKYVTSESPPPPPPLLNLPQKTVDESRKRRRVVASLDFDDLIQTLSGADHAGSDGSLAKACRDDDEEPGCSYEFEDTHETILKQMAVKTATSLRFSPKPIDLFDPLEYHRLFDVHCADDGSFQGVARMLRANVGLLPQFIAPYVASTLNEFEGEIAVASLLILLTVTTPQGEDPRPLLRIPFFDEGCAEIRGRLTIRSFALSLRNLGFVAISSDVEEGTNVLASSLPFTRLAPPSPAKKRPKRSSLLDDDLRRTRSRFSSSLRRPLSAVLSILNHALRQSRVDGADQVFLLLFRLMWDDEIGEHAEMSRLVYNSASASLDRAFKDSPDPKALTGLLAREMVMFSELGADSESVAPQVDKLHRILLHMIPTSVEVELRAIVAFCVLRRMLESDEDFSDEFYSVPDAVGLLRVCRILQNVSSARSVDYYRLDVALRLLDLSAGLEHQTVQRQREYKPLVERLRKIQSSIRDRINDLDGTRVKDHVGLIVRRWEAVIRTNESFQQKNLYDYFGE